MYEWAASRPRMLPQRRPFSRPTPIARRAQKAARHGCQRNLSRALNQWMAINEYWERFKDDYHERILASGFSAWYRNGAHC